MVGTASTVSRWVLLEQPGPWGFDALSESRLPRRVARDLRARSRELGFRVVLLRRPGRHTGRGARCFLACSGPGRPWVEALELGHPRELLDVDLAPLAEGRPPGAGTPDPAPLFLVCTNGRRDPCCAEQGRPLARDLAATRPGRVWECSHIGGDRFAANLVCFPHGLYFGRLGPEAGQEAASLYERGLIDLAHYRGRSCYDFAVQAAEEAVRRELGLAGVEDLRLEESRALSPGRLLVRFASPGGDRHEVVVRSSLAAARPLTCHADRVGRPAAYTVERA